MNWNKQRRNIPEKIRTGNRKVFSVLWIDHYEDPSGVPLAGGTNFKPKKEILLNPGFPDKEVVHTFFHEYLHSVSYAHEIGLTETQVEKLEKAYPYIREFILTLEGKK